MFNADFGQILDVAHTGLFLEKRADCGRTHIDQGRKICKTDVLGIMGTDVIQKSLNIPVSGRGKFLGSQRNTGFPDGFQSIQADFFKTAELPDLLISLESMGRKGRGKAFLNSFQSHVDDFSTVVFQRIQRLFRIGKSGQG